MIEKTPAEKYNLERTTWKVAQNSGGHIEPQELSRGEDGKIEMGEQEKVVQVLIK